MANCAEVVLSEQEREVFECWSPATSASAAVVMIEPQVCLRYSRPAW
ncbi:MAG TPA: hypothetical protein VIH92_06645 [Solirubrobacteraceae bacterium]